MLQVFRKWSDRRRDNSELAELRFFLDAMQTLMSEFERPEDRTAFMVGLGIRIRKVPEHRFAWARETFTGSDDDLRSEERQIDAMSLSNLADLYERVRCDAEDSAEAKELELAMAMCLLAGWIKSKLIGRRTQDRSIRLDARAHESIHLSHIKNLMRIIRDESPPTDDE